jgi:hypothetical protein
VSRFELEQLSDIDLVLRAQTSLRAMSVWIDRLRPYGVHGGLRVWFLRTFRWPPHMDGVGDEEVVTHELLRMAVVSARSWKRLDAGRSPTTHTTVNWKGHFREFLGQLHRGTHRRLLRAERLELRNRAAEAQARRTSLTDALVDSLRVAAPSERLDTLVLAAEQYLIQRLRLREVADQLGVNPATAARYMGEARVVMREMDATRREARGEAPRDADGMLDLAHALRDLPAMKRLTPLKAAPRERPGMTRKEERAAGAAVVREREADAAPVIARLVRGEDQRGQEREDALAARVAQLGGILDEMELVVVLVKDTGKTGRRYGMDCAERDEGGDVRPVRIWRRRAPTQGTQGEMSA